MQCRESDVASTENGSPGKSALLPVVSRLYVRHCLSVCFFRDGAGTRLLMKVLISSDLLDKKVSRSAFKLGQDTFYSD